MRACTQCGLSIGESATFCPVCGARTGADEVVAGVVASGASLEAVVEASGVSPDLEFAAYLEAAPVTGHSAIPDVEPETREAELVANLAAEHVASPAAAFESESWAEDEAFWPAEFEAGPVVGPEPEAEAATVEPEPTADPAPEAVVEAAEATDAARDELLDSPRDSRDRKMAAIAALLELGSRCEKTDPARAAAAYGDAVVGCLEATDDPLGSEPVRRDLLHGFDRLSFVLERQGLPDEALAVVDDAAALGLLDGADEEFSTARGSLAHRREDLRRAVHGDPDRL